MDNPRQIHTRLSSHEQCEHHDRHRDKATASERAQISPHTTPHLDPKDPVHGVDRRVVDGHPHHAFRWLGKAQRLQALESQRQEEWKRRDFVDLRQERKKKKKKKKIKRGFGLPTLLWFA